MLGAALPRDDPMVAASYSNVRSETAKRLGRGRKRTGGGDGECGARGSAEGSVEGGASESAVIARMKRRLRKRRHP
jgi:hypothetical protein